MEVQIISCEENAIHVALMVCMQWNSSFPVVTEYPFCCGVFKWLKRAYVDVHRLHCIYNNNSNDRWKYKVIVNDD